MTAESRAETVPCFRAPGRVNLMGDHTDYNQGLVLPVAIDRETVVTARRTEDERVRLRSEGHEGTVDVAADGSDEPRGVDPEWGRLVSGVVAALAERGRRPVGIDADVGSTVPEGSGLSSSASFEVALALALCHAAAFELAEVELALACQEAEQRATGVPSGVMDQLASLCGVAGAALLIDCRSLEVDPVPLPAGLGIVAVHSGVPRRLEVTEYADRRAACEAAAQALGLPSLREATYDQVRDDPIGRHVVTENERVRATATALASGASEDAGRLFLESHASLRDDFDVSTPELDVLVEELVRAGSYGARLTGAGFGGCVVAIAPAGEAAAIARGAAERYAGRTGRTPEVYECVPAGGAGVAQSSPIASASRPQA
jgi:galactokinase